MVPRTHARLRVVLLLVQRKCQESPRFFRNVSAINIVGAVKVAEYLRKQILHRPRCCPELFSRCSQSFIKLLQRVVADAQLRKHRSHSGIDYSILLGENLCIAQAVAELPAFSGKGEIICCRRYLPQDLVTLVAEQIGFPKPS